MNIGNLGYGKAVESRWKVFKIKGFTKHLKIILPLDDSVHKTCKGDCGNQNGYLADKFPPLRHISIVFRHIVYRQIDNSLESPVNVFAEQEQDYGDLCHGNSQHGIETYL